MGRREARWRRALAAVVTAWLAGLAPAIAFTSQWPHKNDPQVYAWWIILGPLIAVTTLAALVGLGMFYRWALAKPSQAELQARINELEHELGIASLDERRRSA